MLDSTNHNITFALNGEDLGPAFSLPSYLHGHSLFPAISLKNAEVTVHFDCQSFHHRPPPGFVAFNDAPSDWTSTGELCLLCVIPERWTETFT